MNHAITVLCALALGAVLWADHGSLARVDERVHVVGASLDRLERAVEQLGVAHRMAERRREDSERLVFVDRLQRSLDQMGVRLRQVFDGL